MKKHIAIIQGHPDTAPARYTRVFAEHYRNGAEAGGHTVEVIDVASLNFPHLHSKEEFEHGAPPPEILRAQEIIARANHLVVIFPLWLGDIPSILKAFFEQTFRPGFAYSGAMDTGKFKQSLRGKSARVVVTMGMPAFVYRFYFGAHGLKNLRRNVLKFCGISPVRESIIGLIESKDPRRRQRWLVRAEELGRKGG